MDKNLLNPNIERLKQILIEAYQKGELSVDITAREIVERLAEQLKDIFSSSI